MQVSTQKHPPFTDMLVQLAALGYTRVPMVVEKGEFSVRGGIVDIYPPGQDHPVRIEFDGNTIERIARFSVTDQRSLESLDKLTIRPAVVAEHSLFKTHESTNEDLVSQLKPGDYIVHEDHGIGIYEGLVRLKLRREESEYLHIRYKGKDTLYVPIDQMDRVFRYSGSEIHPTIHGLSDGAWSRTKTYVKRATVLLAQRIYDLQKQRMTEPGFACKPDSAWQAQFEAQFAFTETPDQLTAIAAVKTDMESPQPMDRLLCGDVGYGKTEVILRAAFKMCDNLKQVAILVPTTLLADQHFQTFSQRFSAFPFRVEVLSRFRTTAEQKSILADLKAHKVDVIIGTHRLLQKDVAFADLGLVVVDEEQRFGVTHKERLKELKPHVDVLTVTATPIPRTLYLSLSGAKDMSVLETPPQNRKSVLTAIAPFSRDLVSSGVNTELARQGQIFYLYNSVQKIEYKRAQLQALLPRCRIGVGHGQMGATQLEDVFHQFGAGRFDLLLCTTIVENGLDLPRANTIIIEHADRYGLAQIHQLRGRVGRTALQGYAYLLYASELTEVAEKRLAAIRDYASLGAGYKLALRDLEIRGAGTLLGHKQSGHITAVGFDLYCKLLKDAVHRVTGTRETAPAGFRIPPNIKAFIPDTYITSPAERLAIYDRFKTLFSPEDVDDLAMELEDRYGPLPEIVILLLGTLSRTAVKPWSVSYR